MLKQKNRFHGHGSLRFVYKNGQSMRSPQVTIKYIHNPRRKNSRYTVVISKKVVKSAAGRNRVRRRIYEIVRLEQPTLKDNCDIAIMVFSSEVLLMSHQDLTDLIKRLFSRAGLYK